MGVPQYKVANSKFWFDNVRGPLVTFHGHFLSFRHFKYYCFVHFCSWILHWLHYNTITLFALACVQNRWTPWQSRPRRIWTIVRLGLSPGTPSNAVLDDSSLLFPSQILEFHSVLTVLPQLLLMNPVVPYVTPHSWPSAPKTLHSLDFLQFRLTMASMRQRDDVWCCRLQPSP